MNPFFRLVSGKIERATKDSAAFDLFYSGDQPILVGDKPILIPTNVHSEFSPGYVAIMKERSGLGLKGLELKAGVIDADYRGEWGVVARFPVRFTFREYVTRKDENAHFGGPPTRYEDQFIQFDLTWQPFVIEPGAKIAQFILIEVAKLEMVNGGGHFNFLDDVRNERGFGSSG